MAALCPWSPQRKQVDILLPFHHVFGMTSPTLNLEAPSFHVGGKTCICLPSDFTTSKMFATSLGATTSKISSVVCNSDPRPSANAVKEASVLFYQENPTGSNSRKSHRSRLRAFESCVILCARVRSLECSMHGRLHFVICMLNADCKHL